MSLFKKGICPAPILNEAILKLKKAFPSLPIGFFDVLIEQFFEAEFSEAKVKQSINFVIQNCIYPTPTIANFLKFDKKIKLYTYEQILKITNETGGLGFKNYKSINVGLNFPMYAHITDIEKYQLELFKKE